MEVMWKKIPRNDCNVGGSGVTWHAVVPSWVKDLDNPDKGLEELHEGMIEISLLGNVD